MFSLRKLKYIAFFAFAALLVPAQSTAKPMRIVSLHLCADQYLMSLADPDQVAALGPFAADPKISNLAQRANGFRLSSARAEDILLLEPDLVITGAFSNAVTSDFLKSRGVRVFEMGAPDSLEEIYEEIRTISDLIGQRARGDQLIDDIRAAQTSAGREGRGRRFLYLQRRGFIAGDNSLLARILADAGFINAAPRGVNIGQVPLEVLVGLSPDIVIAALAEVPPSGPREASDQGMALLTHPALRSGFGDAKWFAMPTDKTVCTGPSTAEIFNRLGEITAALQ